MRGSRCWLLVALLAACGASQALAAPPWRKINLFKRIEANPDKDYTLTENQGPWMIVCCTFSGEGAEDDAHALVLELRKRYKLPAYVHAMEFDFSKSFNGRGFDQYGDPKRMRHLREIKTREIAVMVGDYRSVDDSDAQSTLKKLRYAKPECLKLENQKKVTRTLARLREEQKYILAPGEERKERGPMGHAFMTSNPLLPKEFFVPEGLDPFVVKLNEQVEHSLLDCPGKYSVQVAMFTGGYVQTNQPSKLAEAKAKLDAKMSASDKLEVAADNAHRLTVALRAKGFEAYEFHDRYSSVVCVGSFDTLGNTGPNGRTDLHPAILKIMTSLGAQQPERKGGIVLGGARRRKIDGIELDAAPMPVEVPRRDNPRGFQQVSAR